MVASKLLSRNIRNMTRRPTNFCRSVPFLLLTLFIVQFWNRAHAEEQSAGWAQMEITPPLGIALGGRGGNYVLAKQVIDPLYLGVIYLEDENGKGMLFASFDLVGLPHSLSDQLRLSAVQELGIDWNLVVLNSSHTHSGPNMLREIVAGVGPAPQIEVDYFQSLREKFVEALRQVRKNIRPLQKVEVFETDSQMAINRRGKNKNGGRGILPDPTGPIDEKLWVLKLTPKDGTAPAIAFSYACHPVIVYGYAAAAISADFPGAARNAIHQSLGEKTHVQFLQGFAGNVRPRAVADLKTLTFRGGNPEKLSEAGGTLAADVLRALKGRSQLLTLDLCGVSDRPLLLRDTPPSREVYEKMAKEAANSYSKAVADYWLKRYDSGEGFAKGDPWATGLIRLSKEQWIVYMAGEPVVEWHKKISEWLAPRRVVTFGYAPEANTYLPTEELLPEGGYEVIEANRARLSSPAPFAPGLHQSVRQSLLRQAAFIEAKQAKKK